MKLKVTDYSVKKELLDAIRNYHILLRMVFDTTNIFKLYETSSESQIYRFQGVTAPPPPIVGVNQNLEQSLFVEAKCGNCSKVTVIQASFVPDKKLIKPATLKFPKRNVWTCENCRHSSSIIDLRRQIEAQTKQKIVD